MDNKKVSIVIPAYNVEKYIHRGLDSCIGQSYSNIDIVVVDDGSSDETANIIKKYLSKDERIKYLSQKNKGVSAARNNALMHATGDYVVFLDSDDWLEEKAIEILMNSISGQDKTFVICSRYIVDENNLNNRINYDKRKYLEIVRNEKILESFLNENFYFQSSCYKLFDLNIIREKQIFFSEDISHGEDGLFVFEYLQNVSEVLSIPIPLWNILNRTNSASNSSFNEKKLSAITAAEKMLVLDISNSVKKEVMRYLVNRAETIFLEACKDGIVKNKSALVLIRKKLRKYSGVLLSCRLKPKEKIRYFIFVAFPFDLFQVILNLRKYQDNAR